MAKILDCQAFSDRIAQGMTTTDDAADFLRLVYMARRYEEAQLDIAENSRCHYSAALAHRALCADIADIKETEVARLLQHYRTR